jgi:hypothetical protein
MRTQIVGKIRLQVAQFGHAVTEHRHVQSISRAPLPSSTAARNADFEEPFQENRGMCYPGRGGLSR